MCLVGVFVVDSHAVTVALGRQPWLTGMEIRDRRLSALDVLGCPDVSSHLILSLYSISDASWARRQTAPQYPTLCLSRLQRYGDGGRPDLLYVMEHGNATGPTLSRWRAGC
jgi:hypothetical protein